MSSPDQQIANLTLRIDAGEDAGDEELDYLTRQLLDEIRELNVESVELVEDETVPVGAKLVEAVTLGTLALAVLPAAVPDLIRFLQSWSTRGEGRTVKIKTQKGDQALEVEYDPRTMSPADLKTLIETLNETLTEKDDN